MLTSLSKYMYIGVFLICQTLLAYLFNYQVIVSLYIGSKVTVVFSIYTKSVTPLLKNTLDCGQGLCYNVNR